MRKTVERKVEKHGKIMHHLKKSIDELLERLIKVKTPLKKYTQPDHF
jgi:hypothetical protein